MLDSSICIPLINGRDSALTERYVSIPQGSYAISSVIKAELLAGARSSTQLERSIERLTQFWSALVSVPFDDLAAEHYGEICAALKKKGRLIGARDLLIAATARANGLTVLTRNASEFRRVPELEVEKW